MDRNELPEYKIRVIVERGELADKLARLGKFLDGDPVTIAGSNELMLLQRQRVEMAAYLATLDARLALWGIVP